MGAPSGSGFLSGGRSVAADAEGSWCDGRAGSRSVGGEMASKEAGILVIWSESSSIKWKSWLGSEVEWDMFGEGLQKGARIEKTQKTTLEGNRGFNKAEAAGWSTVTDRKGCDSGGGVWGLQAAVARVGALFARAC